jgi:hypothetical protein
MNVASDVWEKREVDLDKIGEGVSFLGPAHWQPRMIFSGFPDVILKANIAGFPSSLKGRGLRHSHPIFVLECNSNLSHRTCPCTSKYTPGTKYIQAGCRLEYSRRVMDRTSFILEHFAFNLPAERDWMDKLRFWGKVPEGCIKNPIKQD